MSTSANRNSMAIRYMYNINAYITELFVCIALIASLARENDTFSREHKRVFFFAQVPYSYSVTIFLDMYITLAVVRESVISVYDLSSFFSLLSSELFRAYVKTD